MESPCNEDNVEWNALLYDSPDTSQGRDVGLVENLAVSRNCLGIESWVAGAPMVVEWQSRSSHGNWEEEIADSVQGDWKQEIEELRFGFVAR